jgi:ElaB/YqjD/DUF883 family membrane-anchored ribosome-binding protein
LKNAQKPPTYLGAPLFLTSTSKTLLTERVKNDISDEPLVLSEALEVAARCPEAERPRAAAEWVNRAEQKIPALETSLSDRKRVTFDAATGFRPGAETPFRMGALTETCPAIPSADIYIHRVASTLSENDYRIDPTDDTRALPFGVKSAQAPLASSPARMKNKGISAIMIKEGAKHDGLYQAHLNTIKTVLTAGLSAYLRQQGDPDPNRTLKGFDTATLKRTITQAQLQLPACFAMRAELVPFEQQSENVEHNGSSFRASILAGVAGADGLAVVQAPSRDMDDANLCRHMLLVPRDDDEQRRLLNLGAVARCHHPAGAWSDCDLMVRAAAEVMGNLVAALTPPRPPVPAYDELADAQSMLLALADNMAQVQAAMVRKGMPSPYDHIDVFESHVFAEQLGRDPAAFHADLDEAQLLRLEKGEIELAPDFLKLDARLAELLWDAISTGLADELDSKYEIAEAVADSLGMEVDDVLKVSDVIPRTLQLYGTVVPTSGEGNVLYYPDGSAIPSVVANSLFERKIIVPRKLHELSNLRDELDHLLVLSDKEAEEVCKAALGRPGDALRKARALAEGKSMHIRNDAAREFLELFDTANKAVPVQVMAVAASVSLAFRGVVDPTVAQKMSKILEENEAMGDLLIALAGDALRYKIVNEASSYDGLTRMESLLERVEAGPLATMMLDVTVAHGDNIECRQALNIPRPSLDDPVFFTVVKLPSRAIHTSSQGIALAIALHQCLFTLRAQSWNIPCSYIIWFLGRKDQSRKPCSLAQIFDRSNHDEPSDAARAWSDVLSRALKGPLGSIGITVEKDLFFSAGGDDFIVLVTWDSTLYRKSLACVQQMLRRMHFAEPARVVASWRVTGCDTDDPMVQPLPAPGKTRDESI